MARIRTVKPEFWSDAKVCRVSRDARLLFIGLLNEADDEGRLLSSCKRLAGALFPHDADVTATEIARWLAELEAVGMVLSYEVDGVPYAALPKFKEHQRINRASESKLPAPPAQTQTHCTLTEPSVSPHDTLSEGAVSPHCKLTEPSVSPHCKSSLGTGNREQGTGNREGETPPPSGIVDIWNSTAGSTLPRVRELTPQRTRHLAARRRPERTADWWAHYFTRIAETPFLAGANGRRWRASFDFAIRSEDVVARVLEGVYDDDAAPILSDGQRAALRHLEVVSG